MDNYRRALIYARELFLQWDQAKIIARCGLRADDEYIHIAFLGRPYRIRRSDGRVDCIDDGVREADFSEALTIYDYICRSEPMPGLSGRLLPVNGLRHAARSSSPNDSSFHQKSADYLQQHQAALAIALQKIGLAPFPQGDAACMFALFDGFTAVFQFWAGDEEFPPSVRFLWDENTPDYLKYETVYYAMGCFLARLEEIIADIERNC